MSGAAQYVNQTEKISKTKKQEAEEKTIIYLHFIL